LQQSLDTFEFHAHGDTKSNFAFQLLVYLIINIIAYLIIKKYLLTLFFFYDSCDIIRKDK